MSRARMATLMGLLALPLTSAAQPEPTTAPRMVRFDWIPPGANPADYEMREPEDQHRIVLVGNVARGGRYPVVVALHGQPRRGQEPRRYAFAGPVIDVARSLAAQGEVRPFVLVLPVFRFHGTNWPSF